MKIHVCSSSFAPHTTRLINMMFKKMCQ